MARQSAHIVRRARVVCEIQIRDGSGAWPKMTSMVPHRNHGKVQETWILSPSTLATKFSWNPTPWNPSLEWKRTYTVLSEESMDVVGRSLPHTTSSNGPTRSTRNCCTLYQYVKIIIEDLTIISVLDMAKT